MTKSKVGTPVEEKPTRPVRTNQRKPIGRGNKLWAEKRPGYTRRFVNNVDGRISQFLDAGYTIVQDGSRPDSGQVGEARSLGSSTGKHVGNGVNAILMEIPDTLYVADQEAKQRDVDSRAAAMFKDKSGKDITDDAMVYGEGVKSGRPTIEM